jgi:hypothetical protein
MPDLDTPQGAAAYASQYDQYVQDVGAALQASSGLEREKLAAQLKDAEAGRANAYKIAKLQADVSRYGIDMQRKTALDQLKENARQFDASHALEMERFSFEKDSWAKEFGLSYADKATEYLSTPDRYFQGADFRSMADRALTGAYGGGETSQGPLPYGAQGQPTPKTEADFAVLASYGQPGSNASAGWYPGAGAAPASPPPSGPSSPQMGGQTSVPAGGSSDLVQSALDGPSAWTPGNGAATEPQFTTQPVNGDGTARPAPDPRAKVLKTMIDAMPPSATAGYDANDLAVMQAARAIYSTNLQPGALQRMRPGQRSILASAGKRLGYDVKDWEADVAGYAPNQRSVRAV